MTETKAVSPTPTEAAVAEPIKNCAGCSKPLKKKKKYYRNGKYYCNKNCFKNQGKPKAEEKKKE
jgi:formylmethanofuran dehydrogenase subunit E